MTWTFYISHYRLRPQKNSLREDHRKPLIFHKILVGAVGIEPSSPLQTRKLFILRSDKKYKNARNAEVRYTPGTRTPSPLGAASGECVGAQCYFIIWSCQDRRRDGDGCCTTLTGVDCRRAGHDLWPALRGVTAFPAFPAHETRTLS